MHPWYAEEAGFFGPSYLEEYDDMLTPDRTRREVDFLEQHLPARGRVLDLNCGHGRHAVELAGRGFIVIGQDLNAFFLGEAQRKALDRGVEVAWLQRDMRDIRFDGELDAVVNLFTAFGYFETRAEDQSVLHAIARALKPGGRFILDMINAERLFRMYRPKDWQELRDGSLLLHERRYDFLTGRNLETRTRVFIDGRRRTTHVDVRIYALHELADMLHEAGLVVNQVYGDYDAQPLDLDSVRYLIIASKPTARPATAPA